MPKSGVAQQDIVERRHVGTADDVIATHIGVTGHGLALEQVAVKRSAYGHIAWHGHTREVGILKAKRQSFAKTAQKYPLLAENRLLSFTTTVESNLAGTHLAEKEKSRRRARGAAAALSWSEHEAH